MENNQTKIKEMTFKGEVSRKFDVISKSKNVGLTTKTKNYCQVLL